MATIIGSLLLDAKVHPRRRSSLSGRGLALHLLLMTALFGLFLAGSGSGPVSAVLALTLMALLTAASNAKYAMLGEPLLFSDLTLIVAVFRHPRFYLTAVPAKRRWGFLIVAPILLLALAALFAPRWEPHLTGFALLATGIGGLAGLLRGPISPGVAETPDIEADLVRHGLIATLLLYWRRWQETVDPVACPSHPLTTGDDAPDVIVIVQCESFADPVELTGNSEHLLPSLAAAREQAWQYGDLGVSGFGAYTMRTEYGVLFGRSEADLGFRRYDPFLTAEGEASYALTSRLRDYGYHGLFIHPHDMRFYGRDRLMPAIGFDEIIGEERFWPIGSGGHRYVNDRMLGAATAALIDKADGKTLIYAVTMENHGPWDKDELTGSLGGLGAYLEHLRSSDDMLGDLAAHMGGAGRAGLLVFFGDHRPSIPGVVEPGGARHTPYVMLRFGADGRIRTDGNRRVDLTPDELHHTILRCVLADDVGCEASVAVNPPEVRG